MENNVVAQTPNVDSDHQTMVDQTSDPHASRPDSAVGVFSDTFSSPGVYQNNAIYTVKRSGKVTIESLPPEVLLIIFNEVFLPRDGMSPATLPDMDLDDEDIEVASPSLFPYAIAAVCLTWQRIMSMVSRFWTCLVVFVDSRPTSLSVIQSQLMWSRGLPLDVTITRRFDDHITDDHDERARVMSVMKILGPHIPRCQSLHLDVLFSSSIPSFPYDFHGNAPILRRLKLECQLDDGGAAHEEVDNRPSVTTELEPLEPFQCPELTSFMINGRNFYNACRKNLHWTDMFHNLAHISISVFEASEKTNETFPASELVSTLRRIPKLKTLRLSDLQLVPTPYPTDIENLPEIQDLDWHLPMVVLTDIHEYPTFWALFHAIGVSVENTCLTRCMMDRYPYFGGRLSLDGITDEDINITLSSWLGEDLRVDDCPSFNDRLLAMMIENEEDGTYTVAANLSRLEIINCSNCSVESLKRMVAHRRDYVPDHIANPWPAFAIQELYIHGMAFSPENLTWFHENVPSFGHSHDMEDLRLLGIDIDS